MDYIPPNTLFHYTTFDGFKGIAESKQLWLSDLRSTNDPRELVFGIAVFGKALDMWADRNLPVISCILFKSYVTEVLTWEFSENQYFSASFTEAGDSEHMWKNYGAAGEGVAVGFRPTGIGLGDNGGVPGRLQRVSYLALDPLETAQSKHPLMVSFEEAFKADAFDLARTDAFDPARHNFGLPNRTSTALKSLFVASKEMTWQPEQEIRKVFAQVKVENRPRHPNAKQRNGLPFYYSEFERTSVSGPIKYLKLPFGKLRNGVCEPDGAIETVTLGCGCPATEVDIREFLEKLGFRGFTVQRSICKL